MSNFLTCEFYNGKDVEFVMVSLQPKKNNFCYIAEVLSETEFIHRHRIPYCVNYKIPEVNVLRF